MTEKLFFPRVFNTASIFLQTQRLIFSSYSLEAVHKHRETHRNTEDHTNTYRLVDSSQLILLKHDDHRQHEQSPVTDFTNIPQRQNKSSNCTQSINISALGSNSKCLYKG